MKAQLSDNYKTIYNGVEVKWFIGDINFRRAADIGCCDKSYDVFIAGCGELRVTKHDGAYWEAWGSCLGRAYQLFAWYNAATNELSDITPLTDNGSIYFSKENYERLTQVR